MQDEEVNDTSRVTEVRFALLRTSGGGLALGFVPEKGSYAVARGLFLPLCLVLSFPAREEGHLVEDVLLPLFSSFFSALVREAARPFTGRSRDTFDAASLLTRPQACLHWAIARCDALDAASL